MLNPTVVLGQSVAKTEFEKIQNRKAGRQFKRDSTLNHLKGNWQVSVQYGLSILSNPAPFGENGTLKFPGVNNSWKLSVMHFPSESFSLEAKFAFEYDRLAPDIDRQSILNGATLDAEGGALSLIPISLEANYYIKRKRFRPYLGIGIGFLRVNSILINATGTISSGIDQEETRYSSSAPFLAVATGFYYRSTQRVQLGLHLNSYRSGPFSESIAGFDNYQGVQVNGSLSLLF